MLVGLKDSYYVKSNRESGFGRYDIMLEPKDKNGNSFVMEFKVYKEEKEKTKEDKKEKQEDDSTKEKNKEKKKKEESSDEPIGDATFNSTDNN